MLPINAARQNRWRIDALELGWLALAIAIPLAINPWGSNAFELPKAALLKTLVLLMLLLVLFRFSTQRATRPHIDWNILALISTFTLATIFSINPRASLWGDYARQQGLLTTLAYLGLFLICSAYLRTRAAIDRLWRVLVWTSVPIVLYALAQAVGFDAFDWRSDANAPLVSTLGRSNFAGTYLVLIFPLTLARFLCNSRSPSEKSVFPTVSKSRFDSAMRKRVSAHIRKPIYALLVTAQLLCLVLTQAHGAWLGIGVALVTLIFVWAILHRKKQIVLALVTLSVCAILLATFFIVPSLQTTRGSTAARLTIWQTTLPLVAARPLLGYGPETMQFAFVRVFPPQLVYYQGRQFAVDRAHNLWLDLAMSTGWVGVICFIAFVLVLARRVWNRWQMSYRAEREISNRDESRFLLASFDSLRSFRIARRNDRLGDSDRWEQFLWMGLTAAVVGHLTDLQFAFDVTAAATIFWLVLALITAMSRAGDPSMHRETIPLHAQTLLPFAPAVMLVVLIIGTIGVRPVLADNAFRESQIETRSLPEQIASAEHATQLWPIEPEYHLRLGWIYAQAGMIANYENEFVAVEQLIPEQPRIWATRGDVYARLGRYELAENAYRRATVLAPNIAVYHSALGWTLAQQTQLAPAAMELRRAVDLDATDAMAYEELGRVYALLGQQADATWAWQEAARWRDKK
ncbi:MAG: O-antigen ligase family protein [Chloroflexi bacterium]|nr:O-antigen ligase family protein [Chloroflexota bacterium]